MAIGRQFEKRDTQVLGISTDARPTQAAYYLCMGPTLYYPIPLLSDFHPKGEVSRLYGVYDDEKGTAKRAVIMIDKGGIVRSSRLYTSVIKAGTTGQAYVESDLDAANVLTELDRVLAAGEPSTTQP